MNKKLLAAAIAGALAIPAVATADNNVTVYGAAKLSIENLDSDADDAVDPTLGVVHSFEDQDGWDVVSRASRLGFKGSEDLGDGLKAIWKMEFQVDMTDSTSDVITNGRNMYVGFADSWGTFLYGRHDTPYKISTGSLDKFGDTAADYNQLSSIGGWFQDIRAEDAIAYISPSWNGLTFAGALVAGGTVMSTDQTALDDSDINNAMSFALMYNNNGIFASIAYETIDGEYLEVANPTPPPSALNDEDFDKYRIGLGYTGNNWYVNGVYETQEDRNGVKDWDVDNWMISAGYSFGNTTIKGYYGGNDNDDQWVLAPDHSGLVQDDPDNEIFAIGVDHAFSKRTKVYALYTDTDMDEESVLGAQDVISADRSVFAIGTIHTF